MRALKTLLIILLAVVALAAILGLFGPKTSHVSRDVMIAAPANVVWDHVGSLRQNDAWSPFRDMDTTMQVTFEGTDGEVGSKSMWEGKKAGKGMQEITAVDPGRHLEIGLHFTEPYTADATATYDVEAVGDSTKVTWSYDGENNFIARIISVFKDMDAMMGPIFSEGLAKLKTICEADAAKRAEELKARTFGGYVIDTVDRPAMTYFGKRQMVKWDKLSGFFGPAFQQASQAAAKAGLQMNGAPSGLFFTWDEAGKQTDLLAGVPVDKDTTVADFTTVTVPAGKALMIAYHGAHDKSEDAHNAMGDMMKARGLQLRGPVMEEYVVSPAQEPDTAKWLTNIYYPIK